ncbi:Protein CBG23490 [Caenorhabditis briggsae]|uniref:Protein CBG23490 n=1 Tax=Caenorhabditis briggsae TaxID=6238 RepID=A8Y3S8_CAEBR|nr:Protein CBG23490 [Caenorhabditis briggsae]CAP39547.1 Protein CBG23490 [Caenorhabditis briggsae]
MSGNNQTWSYSTQSPQQPVSSQYNAPYPPNNRGPQPANQLNQRGQGNPIYPHGSSNTTVPIYIQTPYAGTPGSVPSNADPTFPSSENNRTVTTSTEPFLNPIYPHGSSNTTVPIYIQTPYAGTSGSVPSNADPTFPSSENNRTVTTSTEPFLVPHLVNTAVTPNAWYDQNRRGQEISINPQRCTQNSSSLPQLVHLNVQQLNAENPSGVPQPIYQIAPPSYGNNSMVKNHKGFFSGTVTVVTQNSVSPAEQQLQDELDRMRQEDERVEREREEKIKRRNEERLRKAKEMQELMETNLRKENEIEAARRNEAKIRMNEEIDSLKNENLYKDRLKEQAYLQELLELKREGDQERRNIEDQREKERMKHEKIIMAKDRKFEQDTIMYEKEDHLRKEELIRIQEKHEERTRLIYEEMERKMEEVRRLNKEKMNQMRKQWQQIQKMLQMKVWNVIIENNWTNRLNVLRNSNRNIMDLFKRFYAEANKIQRHCDRSEDVSREIQRIVPVLKALIGAVGQVENLMNEESEVLYDQWQNTGKSFVYCIKDSVDKVKYTCKKLRSSLKNYGELLKKEPTYVSSQHESYLDHIKKDIDDVSMYSNKIPTLAELKQEYSNDMRSETPPNSSSHDLVPFQTVIIEEIE